MPQARRPALPPRARGALFAVALLLSLGSVSSVSEQRKRLPPPAACGGELSGVWKSHNYSERMADWTQFTLYLDPDPAEPTKVIGRIVNRSWEGAPEQSEPPASCDGRGHWIVSMDAAGQAKGAQIEVWGVGEWRLDEVLCGDGDFGYNLDHFTGTIDTERQEFQSLNNDGGNAVNEPTVFRRVRCQVDHTEPVGPVPPPPYSPPSSGCGWW